MVSREGIRGIYGRRYFGEWLLPPRLLCSPHNTMCYAQALFPAEAQAWGMQRSKWSEQKLFEHKGIRVVFVFSHSTILLFETHFCTWSNLYIWPCIWLQGNAVYVRGCESQFSPSSVLCAWWRLTLLSKVDPCLAAGTDAI